MKKLLFVFICSFVIGNVLFGQTNRERRLMLNEYVSPEELVSISKNLQFDKAMIFFGDFSKKYVNKIIVDVSKTNKPIGVDISNMYWLQAFETVLRANGLWYDEKEEYFQVYAPIDSAKLNAQRIAMGAAVQAIVDSTSKVIFRTRDVHISSVFLDINITKSLQTGVNWKFLYKGDTTKIGTTPSQFGGEFQSNFKDPAATQSSSGGGSSAGTTITPGFFARALPAISFSNVSALLAFFQSNQLGNVLSGPSLNVTSGKSGKIQVGQDFYITTKDFSGNSIQSVQSTGIIIDVKPVVYEENGIKFISLDIDAQRSSVTGAGTSPVVNKNQAKTYLNLYDGEETIIGGLFTNDESSDRGGVPFLKDLPWYIFGLRYLFGYEATTTTTHELIILMKAEVVPTIEERVSSKARNQDIIEKQRKQNASDIERIKQKSK